MAKRNNTRNTKPSVPQSSKPESNNKITNGLSALGNLLGAGDSEEFGTMANKLKMAKTSSDAASEEQKTKVGDRLDSDIQALVGELKKIIDTKKRLETDIKNSESRAKQLESVAEELKKKIEADRKVIDKELKELSETQKKHAEDKSDIAERLLIVKEQELEAENGFANRKLEMLEKFELDKDKQLIILESRKTKLIQEIEEFKRTKTTLSEQEKTLVDEKLDKLRVQEEKLADTEFELGQQRLIIQRKLKQAELTHDEAESYKNSLREEVQTEYLHKISTLENQMQSLNNQIKKYHQTESELLEQVASFNDIQRHFGDDSAIQILEQLQQYKTRVAALTQELDGKPSQQIESLYKELKNQYESLDQEYTSVQAELKENKTLRYKNQLSVIDLEQVEKQKQAISKHNELLKGAVDQLSADVDDLVNKQQSKTAFPALLNLDNKLRSRAITESIPPLKQFAIELQQRIAWDEKENKALYYRLEDIQLFIAGLSMSRLHILQGISGTGKTSLAKAFARAVGGQCKTIYVQAGWRDKSDLVGHFNAFEKKFYELETLQGLYEAQCPTYSDRPYVILLDEMNLSRPEQYFAQFLSALEMDPEDRVLDLMTTTQANSPERLIEGRKIKIPKNVWFIGTANHDETTYEFADKTYDRSHVMELPRHSTRFEINKNIEPATYSYSSLEQAFENAALKYQDQIRELIIALDESLLSQCLEEYFNVSWGNRLERHLNRFIPVMLESGSDIGFAMDHMLVTKVLRAGKVTGRYDTEQSDIENLIEALDDFWSSQNFKSKPSASLKLLQSELKKKSSI